VQWKKVEGGRGTDGDKVMREMMKRCLSLGFSLTVIVFTGFSRANAPPKPAARRLKAPDPHPNPTPTPPPLSHFSGTVVRDGSRFALRDHDGALFALDSTGKAWPFEGEDVEVKGYLIDASKLLHICSIEAVEPVEAVEDLRAEAV
jgi:hypothetical protein